LTYCTSRGLPRHKFNLQVITNHTYIKKAVENKTYTTYIIMDDPMG